MGQVANVGMAEWQNDRTAKQQNSKTEQGHRSALGHIAGGPQNPQCRQGIAAQVGGILGFARPEDSRYAVFRSPRRVAHSGVSARAPGSAPHERTPKRSTMSFQVAGIEVRPAVIAPLDRGFLPAALFTRKYRELVSASGGVPLRLAFERGDGSISTFSTPVVPPSVGHLEATLFYVERIVKFLLWQRGGWKVYVGGPAEVGRHVQAVYSAAGARKFDFEFMSGVYEHPFEVVVTTAEAVPRAREVTMPLGRHLDGCRVGFDLGASDRKASAVINGEAVFSEEVVWDPRNASDPEYHYQGVMDSIRRAAAHLPRLDAVGGSAAGVYISNRVRIGSL